MPDPVDRAKGEQQQIPRVFFHQQPAGATVPIRGGDQLIAQFQQRPGALGAGEFIGNGHRADFPFDPFDQPQRVCAGRPDLVMGTPSGQFDPVERLGAVRDRNIHGNHARAVLGEIPVEGFDRLPFRRSTQKLHQIGSPHQVEHPAMLGRVGAGEEGRPRRPGHVIRRRFNRALRPLGAQAREVRQVTGVHPLLHPVLGRGVDRKQHQFLGLQGHLAVSRSFIQIGVQAMPGRLHLRVNCRSARCGTLPSRQRRRSTATG